MDGKQGLSLSLLDSAVLSAVGDAAQPTEAKRVFQAWVTATGALTASIKIWGSCQPGAHGVLLGVITLTGNDLVGDGFSSEAPWPHVWAEVSALTGTGARAFAKVGF